jgi:hypothetical protein
MDKTCIDDIPQVSDKENAHLTAPYLEEEVNKKKSFSRWNASTRI